ncbi:MULTISPECIES: DOPA 4,5-dioxygenase family protein [unclassified Agarivorans]|uniref:DOPA 4,5-dioxygenase family protein n=1 Tax=unclassified Agarivorans TaxID=2636026 RepID=UPI003D7E20F5
MNPYFPQNVHKHYHAHVYFDATSLEFATQLCQQAAQKCAIKMGRVHQTLVGPHPHWSCQLSFSEQHFEQLIPWLEAQRQDLNILVHAQTGNNLRDHTEYAYWLGTPQSLNLSMFKKGSDGEDDDS